MIKFKDIKVVILCGGLGSELSEETSLKPKPYDKNWKRSYFCFTL